MPENTETLFVNSINYDEYCEAIGDQVANLLKRLGSLDRVVIEGVPEYSPVALSLGWDKPAVPFLRLISELVTMRDAWNQAYEGVINAQE